MRIHAHLRHLVAPIALLLTLASCSDPAEVPSQLEFGGERPALLRRPPDYDASRPLPLLVVLHGYGVSAQVVLSITRLRDLPENHPILMIAPEGVLGNDGASSWNVDGVCCGKHDTDDASYLRNLIEEIASTYPIDADNIWIFGHSNGGTMAYQMACEHSDLLRGVISLAGGGVPSCSPSDPVSVIRIHGTNDSDVDFEGGTYSSGIPYLGAHEESVQWAIKNGCHDTSLLTETESLDLDSNLNGAETSVIPALCSKARVELWKMNDGVHNPALRDDFGDILMPLLSGS